MMPGTHAWFLQRCERQREPGRQDGIRLRERSSCARRCRGANDVPWSGARVPRACWLLRATDVRGAYRMEAAHAEKQARQPARVRAREAGRACYFAKPCLEK